MKIKEKTRRKIMKGEKSQRGITLVALVITIIIIIILSTVAISFIFGSNGLINRAQNARGMYANDTAYTEGSIANVDSYINDILIGVGGDDTSSQEQTATTVEEAKTNGLKYLETTQISDVSNETMWIPGGFGIASDSATDIDDGVVITDGTNEFVWIPVSDTDLTEMYSTTTPETASNKTLAQSSLGEATTTTKIYSKIRGRDGGLPASKSYREPDILTEKYYGYGDSSTIENRGINLIKSELGYQGEPATVLKNFAQDMVDEYLTVFKSIKEYDGYYIGRYELTGTTEEPTCQRHQPVLNASSPSVNTWYGLKDACSKVVDSDYAKSHMIYGNQWDEVMDWLVDTEARTSYEVNVNSSTWGNYGNSSAEAAVDGYGDPQKSGYSDTWSANNVYDLAGNYFEWTQEAYDTAYRIMRGRILSRGWTIILGVATVTSICHSTP